MMARYRELREILAGEIAAGVYPVGGRFPTDAELCERFGVSRHTVREALRELQEQGLLARQRGSGSVVQAGRPKGQYAQTLNSLSELDAYAAAAHFEKLAEVVVVAREGLSDLLECAPGAKWLRLSGLRRLADRTEPLCWTELFIAEPFIGARDRLRAGGEPYYEQLRREFGMIVTEVEQKISAIAVSADVAPTLQVEAGSPALLVRRRYFSGDDLVEVSVSLHPADRYAYTARLTRDGAAPNGMA